MAKHYQTPGSTRCEMHTRELGGKDVRCALDAGHRGHGIRSCGHLNNDGQWVWWFPKLVESSKEA